MTVEPVLSQLALDVLIQVHRAAPRSHVRPFLESGLALTLIGAFMAWRLARSRTATLLGAGAGVMLAIALTGTLFRGNSNYGDLAPVRQCVVTTPVLLSADGVTNLLLFAPAAFLAVLAISRPARVVIGLALISVAVEGLQGAFSLGVCDSSDALLNTVGAAAAALAALVVRSAFTSQRVFVPGSDSCPRSS